MAQCQPVNRLIRAGRPSFQFGGAAWRLRRERPGPSFSSDLSDRWGLTGTIAYAPLDVHSVLTLRAADGSTLARSQSHLEIDGAATAVSIDYRFGV